MQYICDWTEYQKVVCPAEDIEAEGFAGVKLKAGGSSSKGWHYVDPFWERSAKAVLATKLLPLAYWYLSPQHPGGQAGTFIDLMTDTDSKFIPVLDVEHEDLNWNHVFRFFDVWTTVTSQKLMLYTRKNFWTRHQMVPSAIAWFPLLEEAHWVSESVRQDPLKPFASHQAKSVQGSWWNPGYGGYRAATLIQFTDNALVAGQRTCASVYIGSKDSLAKALR